VEKKRRLFVFETFLSVDLLIEMDDDILKCSKRAEGGTVNPAKHNREEEDNNYPQC
jgi:hypothetical protein